MQTVWKCTHVVEHLGGIDSVWLLESGASAAAPDLPPPKKKGGGKPELVAPPKPAPAVAPAPMSMLLTAQRADSQFEVGALYNVSIERQASVGVNTAQGA